MNWKNIPEEAEETPKLPVVDDPLVLRMKQYVLSMYEPAISPEEADLCLSTTDIYQAFCSLYHNEILFSKEMVANWLHEQGFQFVDAGQLRFEWLLKRVQ